MKFPLIAVIGAAIILQTGCVTSRRSFALPVPSHDIPAATNDWSSAQRFWKSHGRYGTPGR